MKKIIEKLIDCILPFMGMGFSVYSLWKDLYGGGNPNNAIIWVITFFTWALIIKTNEDKERTESITDRLDILARILLPEFCKGNYAIESYKKLMDFKGPNTWEDVVKEIQEKESKKIDTLIEKAERDSLNYNVVYSQTYSLKEIIEKYIDNPNDKEYFYKLYDLLIKKAHRDGIIYGYELKTMECIKDDN